MANEPIRRVITGHDEKNVAKVIYEGALDALKRFKDDVREVLAGYECGLTFNRYNDIREGDIVEAYTFEEIPR